jgi:hypothetical protein
MICFISNKERDIQSLRIIIGSGDIDVMRRPPDVRIPIVVAGYRGGAAIYCILIIRIIPHGQRYYLGDRL